MTKYVNPTMNICSFDEESVVTTASTFEQAKEQNYGTSEISYTNMTELPSNVKIEF